MNELMLNYTNMYVYTQKFCPMHLNSYKCSCGVTAYNSEDPLLDFSNQKDAPRARLKHTPDFFPSSPFVLQEA